MITGLASGRDDAFAPDSVARQLRNAYGDGVVEAFRKLFQLFRFDPPAAA